MNNIMKYGVDGNAALAPDEDDEQSSRIGVKTPNYRKRPDSNVIDVDFSPRSSRRDAAKSGLIEAEQGAAASPVSVLGGGSSEAKAAEQNQSYGPRFTGKGLPSEKDRVKTGGFLKKRGPLITIVMLLLGGGGLMLGSQSLMPFSLLAQFQENFDSIKTISELRSNSFLKYQLDPNRVKNPIRATMFGSTKFKITARQESKLNKQGITVDRNFEYVDSSGGTKRVTVLKFDDGSGFEPIIIAPNEDIAARIPSATETGHAFSFDRAYSDIADFRNGYIAGSKTWRGAVGAWFDEITVKMLQSNSITRNRFKNFQERVKAEHGGNTKSAAVAMMKERVDNEVEVSARNTDGGEESYEDDGETHTRNDVASDSAGNSGVKGDSGTGSKATLDKAIYKGNKAQIEAYLNDFGNSLGSKASSIASAAVNLACTVFNFIGAVNLMLVAHESLQIIQLVSGYFEAIQKVQAGDGYDSPLNDLSNGLTTPYDTTDDDGNVVRANMTAMASEGITALYGNSAVNQDDVSVSSFNISGRLSTILGALGTSVSSFWGCSIAKAGAAIAGIAIDIATIVGCVLSFGVGCVVSAIANASASMGSGIALSAVIQTASSLLAPLLFKVFSRDIISTLAGEDLGNALLSGANMYMGLNHRSGGGSPTGADGLETFIAAQQEVIANEAQYQRETRNPFDVSSQYTFMGSLMTNVIGVAAQSSSLLGMMSALSSVVGQSVSVLSPIASAVTMKETIGSVGDCPDLESIGAVGDAFCNPYIVSDVATVSGDEWDPATVVEKVDDLNGLVRKDDETEVPEIAKNSNLAKYVVFCANRESPFGVADQNIVNELSSWGTVDTSIAAADIVANGAIGGVPVIGDAVDLIGNSIAMANYGWVSGESCVQGNTVSAPSSPNWDEVKYYQRFVEDQRLAENMGLVEESAVTAFLNEYYEEHPRDNSYEGILARKTGMTKDAVIAVLDELDYITFLAEYDPTYLLPVLDDSEIEVSYDELLPDGIIVDMDTAIIYDLVVYGDTRCRSFAA